MNENTKNILVTGGAGYIGSHTVVELINEGFNPIILDDFRNANPDVIQRIEKITNKKLTFIPKACQDEAELNQAFEKYSFWGIIHFAADKAVGESVEDPLKYFDNNMGGLTAILKAVDKFQVNNFVFSSSCTVYGEPDLIPVTESSPTSFASPYGFTKLTNEQMLEQYSNSNPKFRVVLLRYFNPVGAHESGLIGEEPEMPTNLLPFLTQTAAGYRESLTVFGDDYDTPDGTCIRDYIHVIDLANAHVAALNYLADQNNPSFDVFNIGTGTGTSVKEMISYFVSNFDASLNWEIGTRRAGDIPVIYANVEKANIKLKWSSKYTVQDAIKSAWNFELNRKKIHS